MVAQMTQDGQFGGFQQGIPVVGHHHTGSSARTIDFRDFGDFGITRRSSLPAAATVPPTSSGAAITTTPATGGAPQCSDDAPAQRQCHHRHTATPLPAAITRLRAFTYQYRQVVVVTVEARTVPWPAAIPVTV